MKLSRLTEAVNYLAPEYTTIRLLPHGRVYYLDPFLTGKKRFAKELGESFSCIVPDNTSHLSLKAFQHTTEISLAEEILPEPGDLFSLEGKSYFLVEEYDAQKKVLTLDRELSSDYKAGSSVFKESVFVEVLLQEGDKVLHLRSKYFVCHGDKFRILRSGKERLSSFVEVQAISVTLLVDRGSVFDYRVEFDAILPEGVSGNTYLRAFPAYLSEILQIPTVRTYQDGIGPFVLDFFSGPFFLEGGGDGGPRGRGIPVPEILAVQLLSANLTPFSTTLSQVEKNYPVLKTELFGRYFSAFEPIAGSILLSSSGARGKPDSLGRFGIVGRFSPKLEGDVSWSASFNPSSATTLKIKFHPSQEFDVSLRAGQNHVIIPFTGEECSRLELSAKFQSSSSWIDFGDWSHVGRRVAAVKYSLVQQKIGEPSWGTFGLMAKPVFQNPAELRAKLDFGRLDHGTFIL